MDDEAPDILRVDAEIQRADVLQRANEEAGRHEEEHRDCHLERHEPPAKQPFAPTGDRHAVFQARLQVHAASRDRRRCREGSARKKGRRKRKGTDTPVDRHTVDHRQERQDAHAVEERGQPPGQRQPGDARGTGQHESLRQLVNGRTSIMRVRPMMPGLPSNRRAGG
jgi:hypothetical protein